MTEFLRRLTKILTLKCDEASLLMSESYDRKLRLTERLALRGHLFVCSVCPKLHSQLRLVIEAARRRGSGDAQQQAVEEISNQGQQPNREVQLSDEAKQRLRELVRGEARGN